MDQYHDLKNELITINKQMLSLVVETKSIPSMSEKRFVAWESISDRIGKQLSDEIVRVAVIGSIKSGKSTFVNSLFKGDFVKRGAGVITSIVTRIRTGDAIQATLIFKTWNDINAEMNQALVLFPSSTWQGQNGLFDIRQSQDRQNLKQSIESLTSDQLISNDARDSHVVVLDSYLKSYDQVKDLISQVPAKQIFKDNQFETHQSYVADQTLAVYLKDIELIIPSTELKDNIEIADCQGSDSPNPLHLMMIQEYLLKTNFIIYVISSRTGVRQADIRFLSMIKQMGIISNVFFVLNVDISEHETIEDLNHLSQKVAEELRMITSPIELFTFSALLNLFHDAQRDMSSKDKNRFKQWKQEKNFSLLSFNETQRFNAMFYKHLTKQRFSLLLKNNMERIALIVNGMNDLTRIHQDILLKDRKSAESIIERILSQQQNMEKISTLAKNTLNGAIIEIKRDLAKQVDRFFDEKYGEVVMLVTSFIENYTISTDQYAQMLNESGFSNTLYVIFQDFKKALDRYVTEMIHPKVIGFIVEEENKINMFLKQITISYENMVRESIHDYGIAVKELGLHLKDDAVMTMEGADIHAVKSQLNIDIPAFISSTRYSLKIRTDAILHLSMYNARWIFKKIFRRNISAKETSLKALKRSIRPMKKEIKRSIIDHFRDYRENLKFQYIFKLTDSSSDFLFDKMIDRFDVLTTDLSEMVKLVGEEKGARNNAVSMLQSVEAETQKLTKKINQLREKIHQCENAC